MAGKDPDIKDWIVASSFEMENDKLHQENNKLHQENHRLHQENTKLCSSNFELQHELKELAGDLYRTNNSKAMRIGLLITWVPRKIQNFFKKESDGKDSNGNG